MRLIEKLYTKNELKSLQGLGIAPKKAKVVDYDSSAQGEAKSGERDVSEASNLMSNREIILLTNWAIYFKS